jgi:hypothetical protein
MNNDTMHNGSPEDFTAASLADLERLSTPEEPQDITIGDLIGLLGQCDPASPIQFRRSMRCPGPDCTGTPSYAPKQLDPIAVFTLRKRRGGIAWVCGECGTTRPGSALMFEGGEFTVNS